MTDDDRHAGDGPDAWLDFGQAPALIGLSMPRFLRAIEARQMPTRSSPTGKPGVMKSDLLAWHRRDRDERRAALRAFAGAIDREIFG